MRVQFMFRGLWIEGDVYHDPETGPTYACGGTPEYWNAEILAVTFYDVEDFSSWGLLEDFPDGVVHMVDACHGLTGKLLPHVEAMVMEQWQEDMLDRVCEEASS